MEGTAARSRADRLQLRFLGAAEASLDGRPIAFRTRKSLALLAYLALDPGPHPRERLADLFWPEADVVSARASLRTALNHLRQALGPSAESVFTSTRDSLGVRHGAPVDLDVAALTVAQHMARRCDGSAVHEIEAATAQYLGPFLDGMLLPDAPDVEAWIQAQRTYWRGIEAELLDRLAKLQMTARDLAAAIGTLERWTFVDPDDDIAWQRLIEAHLRSDDTAGGRRAWCAYRKAMAELDAQPSHRMAELGSQVFGRRETSHLPRPAAVVTLAGGTGVWKARLVSEFLRSIGSAGVDVAELERGLNELNRDTVRLRVELETAVDVEQPVMAFAI
jgi:DNA-binding SARP family transcriptional activator